MTGNSRPTTAAVGAAAQRLGFTLEEVTSVRVASGSSKDTAGRRISRRASGTG